jgi:predicted ATP-grasp superfamily ATP-dependent carboligase
MGNASCGIVIFSGYNQRAVIAFLRTLKADGIDRYCIVARDDEDPVLKTVYEDHVLLIRPDNLLLTERFKEYTDMMKEKYGWDSFLVAPNTEGLNRFLIEERESLEKMGYIIPLTDRELYIEISDKKSFSRLCKKNGFFIPEESEFPGKYEKSFVAKPICYRFSGDEKVYSPVLVRSSEEYNAFVSNYPREAFYYQEYLDGGESIYLLYYFSKKGRVYSLKQKNIAQQDNGGSMIISRLMGEKTQTEDEISALFAGVGFTGFVMVEIRRIDDRDYVIEANPRFWGPAQLYVDSGYNLFDAFLSDYGFTEGEPEMEINDPEAYYYWSGGIGNGRGHKQSYMIYAEDWDILESVPDCIERYDIYRRDDTMAIWREESGR